MAQLPLASEDATPFLLKVYVRPAPFRSLEDFDMPSRILGDEHKLLIWRTNTLRDVAQMLSEADSTLSTPLALHAFRKVYMDDSQAGYVGIDVGSGVTRIPLETISDLLSDLDTSNGTETSTSSVLGFDHLHTLVDETSAALTLAQLNVGAGDLLDCAITSDPSLSSRSRKVAGSNTRRN